MAMLSNGDVFDGSETAVEAETDPMGDLRECGVADAVRWLADIAYEPYKCSWICDTKQSDDPLSPPTMHTLFHVLLLYSRCMKSPPVCEQITHKKMAQYSPSYLIRSLRGRIVYDALGTAEPGAVVRRRGFVAACVRVLEVDEESPIHLEEQLRRVRDVGGTAVAISRDRSGGWYCAIYRDSFEIFATSDKAVPPLLKKGSPLKEWAGCSPRYTYDTKRTYFSMLYDVMVYVARCTRSAALAYDQYLKDHRVVLDPAVEFTRFDIPPHIQSAAMRVLCGEVARLRYSDALLNLMYGSNVLTIESWFDD